MTPVATSGAPAARLAVRRPEGRPQGDVVPVAAQQGGVPKGNRARSKDGNPHGTVLQISLLRYRGNRELSARDSAMSFVGDKTRSSNRLEMLQRSNQVSSRAQRGTFDRRWPKVPRCARDDNGWDQSIKCRHPYSRSDSPWDGRIFAGGAPLQWRVLCTAGLRLARDGERPKARGAEEHDAPLEWRAPSNDMISFYPSRTDRASFANSVPNGRLSSVKRSRIARPSSAPARRGRPRR